MKLKWCEVGEELKSVLSGSTIDALLPPIFYAIVNSTFGLVPGVIAALGLAVLLGVFRLSKRQKWQYALGGILGVGLAAALALLTRNAASYFIPAIVSSAVLFLAALVTNLIGKPMSAWVSHLTRGWPIEWFWRADVKPAYKDVTWLWAFFFGLRLAVQIILFQQGQASRLAWANTLLGWPVTIAVLVLSYIFGLWRLHRLGGPGVDEFKEGKDPPWKGQTRGF